MKNKFLYILIAILVNFSFMTNVFAEDTLEFEVYADAGGTEVVIGAEVNVMVGVKSNTYIHACDFIVNSDSNIEFVSVSQMVGNFGAIKGEEKINVMDNGSQHVAPVDGINIMQLKYKINGNGKVIIKTESCVGWEDNKEGSYKDIELNFTTKEKEEDNSLKSIKINGIDISNFSSTGNSYSVEIEEPKFSLSWETTNPDYQNKVVVKMNGTVVTEFNDIVWSDPTNQKIAELEIIVNDKQTYSIGVKYEKKDLNNTLKSLKINGEVIELKDGETKYSIKVPSNVTSVKVEAVLNDSTNFKLDDTFVNGVKTHSVSGNSQFTIEVNPINDKVGASSLTYIIEVVKEGSKPPVSSSSSSSSSRPLSSDVEKNPQTGDISMFLMALILISSLGGSVFLYQKNMEAYK